VRPNMSYGDFRDLTEAQKQDLLTFLEFPMRP